MILTVARRAGATSAPRATSPRQDRIGRGVILGGGLLVLALMAWWHLGLGALLFPPAPGPAQQVATAGSFRVTLVADSGDLLVGEHNTVSLVVDDATHHAVTDATIMVAAEMTTMQMPVPTVTATWANGRYIARPIFSMAGQWRLTITITAPGQPTEHATFPVGVRWHA